MTIGKIAARVAIISAIGACGASASHAQFVWDMSTAASSSGAITNLTVGSIAQGNNNGTTTLLSTTSASSGYAGATGTNNAGAAANVGAFNAATSTYFEFTLTPASGFGVLLQGVDFGARRTATGPQSYEIRTSFNNYGAAAATTAAGASGAWGLAVTSTSLISAPVFSGVNVPLTVRIYGVNGSGAPAINTANWRIDDLTVSGQAAVPEPSTVALLGLTLLPGAALLRRRRK